MEIGDCMSIINEIKKITDKYSDYDKYNLSYTDSDYSELRKFLEKKLLKSPFRRINAKKVLDNFDEVLKHTNITNIDWTSYDSLLLQPDFLEKLS